MALSPALAVSSIARSSAIQQEVETWTKKQIEACTEMAALLEQFTGKENNLL